ncbi:MAG TPA: non-canonical purine NTP diphosphatase [Paludibacteraceae bacterium]|nr:non-canonical purine NTP diphosphatase [Paludibacteraceae bacterium]HPT42985.1 non-canonical purine NTP diphosphatase [Paludibacteraceae bacterium]
MKKIVFATNNRHKSEEVKAILAEKAEIFCLADIGCNDDIPETGSTLEENAILKARYIYEKYNIPCFADDTGLEIDALNGRPGVYSARYAGEPSNSAMNMQKVQLEMEGITNREAQFRTVIAYIENGDIQLFEGIVKGAIGVKPEGNGGFGYDPLFIPEGYDMSFASLSPEVKNTISHRAIAMGKFTAYFQNTSEKQS